MAFSESLAERIRDALARKKAVEEKKRFGGVGFLLNGNMLVGVWKNSLGRGIRRQHFSERRHFKPLVVSPRVQYRCPQQYQRFFNRASTATTAFGSGGFTRWWSNPASAVRRRSSCWPQPVSAANTTFSRPGCWRNRRATS